MILSFPARLRTLAARAPGCAGDHLRRRRRSPGPSSSRAAPGWPVTCSRTASGVGDFVTIALPNSVDWFVAYLAVLEARRHPAAGVGEAAGP